MKKHLPAPPTRTYFGWVEKSEGGPGIVKFQDEGGSRKALNPRTDIRNHSPDGFQWGYAGSGPAQLALALVADATGDDDLARRTYQRFKFKGRGADASLVATDRRGYSGHCGRVGPARGRLMPTVMKQFGDAFGRPLPGDGQYLKSFDFEANDGRGEIALTPDLDEAMIFPDFGAAMAFYRTSPKCRPRRPDGEPNRPLTGANWEFTKVEEDICP